LATTSSVAGPSRGNRFRVTSWIIANRASGIAPRGRATTRANTRACLRSEPGSCQVALPLPRPRECGHRKSKVAGAFR
jgi:hypothetical protein